MYKSKTKLLDRYKDVGEKTLNEKLKLNDEVRKLSSQDISLVTIRDQAKNTLNLVVTTENKMAETRMNLKNILTTDILHIHREIGDIIYTDLLKSTLQVSQLESRKKRVEYLLRKEKVENKSHQTHIKKLQVELLVADSQDDKGATTQKLLKEMENAIQLLKKKMNIPSTQLIQTSKRTKFEKEKEALNTELIDCKERFLNFEEKEKKWEKDAGLWAEKEKAFETK